MTKKANITLQKSALAIMCIIIAIQIYAFKRPLKTFNKVEKSVMVLYLKDSIPVNIDLIYNTNNVPEFYYAYVETPVCESGLCYDLKVNLYWNVLGDFAKYKEVESDPFTKLDHKLFSEEDHLKLIKILKDKTSPLANYEAKDLIDKTDTIFSLEVDAVTGATSPALKSSVVSGAVYSTHILWNIVNGKISDSILKYTEANLLTNNLIESMIYSDDYHLQMYGLRHVNTTLKKYTEYLLRLVEFGEHYVPYFAIDKFTAEMWNNFEIQKQMIDLLEDFNFEMQNETLNRLQHIKIASGNIITLLEQIKYLEKSQYSHLSEIIKYNASSLSKTDKAYLLKLSKDETNSFASFATNILSYTN
ncbi:hypothetical protein FNB79_14965 [Formosa sediminum]|uniref:Uncharacterized protein n=1 Tax=Formosa sediminum TaxID=2594004 RepID=A0A516GUM7_9FLAO|nr:hypothetical protein [Formosa sediminum]QDO95218.1 hypothetical protein FNB79_14965 [Formosa sediminum]